MADQQKRAQRIESEFQALLEELREQDAVMQRLCAVAGVAFEPTVPAPKPDPLPSPVVAKAIAPIRSMFTVRG